MENTPLTSQLSNIKLGARQNTVLFIQLLTLINLKMQQKHQI